LIILTFKSHGQIPDWKLEDNRIDSVCTVTAKNYIYQKLGKTFTDKYLSYYGIFRPVVLFKIKGSHCRHKIIPIYCDTTNIDTNFTKVDKSQILKFLTGKCNKNYWIDTTEALKIAKATTDFKNYEYYTSLVFLGEKMYPRWCFKIYFNASYGNPTGKQISVNPVTEKFMTSYFLSQP